MTRARRRLSFRSVTTHHRPLLDSLTRILAAPPGGARGAARSSAESRADGPGQVSAHHALESALLRGFVYVTSGLVWLLVLGLVVRHVMR